MSDSNYSKFYIGGKWVDPIGSIPRKVINPATEQAIATVTMGVPEDVDRAVSAARSAFGNFSRTKKNERIELLKGILQAYRNRYDEMSKVITAEVGAPKTLSEDEQTAAGVGHAEGIIDALNNLEFRTKCDNGDIILRESAGVCGMITPWNWPINQVSLKVLAALAAGCTMVLKPSELTPLSAMLYADILHDAGVPDGVFNLVNGDGPTVGSAISKHGDIDLMSFTGSTRGGIAVTKDAADSVKRVTLELGGKSPNIIFSDCDLERAVTEGVCMVFSNTGQSCDAPSRMLVERCVYDQAKSIARDLAERQDVGDPSLPGGHIGPLASDIQYERVQALIEAGIEEGATLLAGGPGKPEGRQTGYYTRPTVFADVSNDMRIAREEIFGPVLSIIPFDTEEEAIAIANDTDYGLSSYIQTGDSERADRVASQLRSGMVNINGGYPGSGSPFGGYKMSGVGREGGRHGIDEFLEIKTVAYG